MKTNMLILISPAKLLDFATKAHTEIASQPVFIEQANQLADEMRNYSVEDLMKLMNISHQLAELNQARFFAWKDHPESSDTKQALLAFTGEVFRGIKAAEMNDKDFEFAQKHLRILSGIYGVLRPMDLIQPYRLEMGTKLKLGDANSLYDFWGDRIRKQIEADNPKDKPIINLASNEYFKSAKAKQMKADIITPVFKDLNKGKLKVITIYAKNARGQMLNYIIKNRITEPEQLKAFDTNGYEYYDAMSDDKTWVFVRG
jgi:cytoplasmic iron level regulating protein YaaA (DUF328/UPF0246 family)